MKFCDKFEFVKEVEVEILNRGSWNKFEMIKEEYIYMLKLIGFWSWKDL